MPSTSDLRVAIAMEGADDVSWTVSLDTSMRYYSYTFNTNFNTHALSLYIVGNVTGSEGNQTDSNVYVND